MRDFLTDAQTQAVADTGQIDPVSLRALKRAVKAGDISQWRGHWFPVTGAPWGMGPLKTCYGPHYVCDHFTNGGE